jgi:hypothetical protein
MTTLPEPPPPQRREPVEPVSTAPSKAGPIVMLVGGGLVLLGSFLPWATVTTAFGTISVAGTNGDGTITLVVGLVIVVLSILELTRTVRLLNIWGGFVGGLVATGIGVLDYADVNDRIAGVSSDVAQAAVGVGLYAVIAGGVAVIVGAYLKR